MLRVLKYVFCVFCALSIRPSLAVASPLAIMIEREPAIGDVRPGRISVDGQVIGVTVENVNYQILPDTYRGVLRYSSQKNFVQGPGGVMGHDGDFLIEAAGVPGKTAILLHGGNKPYMSKGCILLGPVGRDPSSLQMTVGPDHPLRILRKLFYGSDTPAATPDKEITITIR